MIEYRKDFKWVEKETYWTGGRVLMFGTVAAVALFFASWVLFPTKILNPDRAIENYEWFHNAHTEFNARVNQLASHKKLVADAPSDKAELSRIRIEIAGIQTSCRNLAAAYNSRATQMHRAIFQGKSIPEKLDASKCE
jgi:hypothetical protein